MNKSELYIDRGDCWEIKNYTPIIERNSDGSIKSVIYCPYIPKFLLKEFTFEGDALGFDREIST